MCLGKLCAGTRLWGSRDARNASLEMFLGTGSVPSGSRPSITVHRASQLGETPGPLETCVAPGCGVEIRLNSFGDHRQRESRAVSLAALRAVSAWLRELGWREFLAGTPSVLRLCGHEGRSWSPSSHRNASGVPAACFTHRRGCACAPSRRLE